MRLIMSTNMPSCSSGWPLERPNEDDKLNVWLEPIDRLAIACGLDC